MKTYRVFISRVIEASSEEEANAIAYQEWLKLTWSQLHKSNYWVEKEDVDEGCSDK